MEEAMVQIAEVKRLYPYSRQVLLLEDISQPQLVTAFRSGAYTLLLRRSSCEALIATLKLVLDGVSVLPTDLLDALLGAREAPVALVPALAPEVDTTSASPDVVRSFGLSTREYSVAQNLREGLSNKEIARLLGITEATVKVHVKAILRKARVRNHAPGSHVGCAARARGTATDSIGQWCRGVTNDREPTLLWSARLTSMRIASPSGASVLRFRWGRNDGGEAGS